MALTPEQKAAWLKEKAELDQRLAEEQALLHKRQEQIEQIDKAIQSVEKKEKKEKIIRIGLVLLGLAIEGGLVLWYFVFR